MEELCCNNSDGICWDWVNYCKKKLILIFTVMSKVKSDIFKILNLIYVHSQKCQLCFVTRAKGNKYNTQ
jgi:hypothetical protein